MSLLAGNDAFLMLELRRRIAIMLPEFGTEVGYTPETCQASNFCDVALMLSQQFIGYTHPVIANVLLGRHPCYPHNAPIELANAELHFIGQLGHMKLHLINVFPDESVYPLHEKFCFRFALHICLRQ